ncbi:uncharacterized protein [Mytilus edulis]|uniref:uncharacterized protein n=1 Tax=Mytilus edulis TaxID=6550 RepID=UPI0039F02518
MTDCAVVYSCYRFDSFWNHSIPWIPDLTNALCENYCKNASAKNIYYGTSDGSCYCRYKELSSSDKKNDNKCTQQLQNNTHGIGGGRDGSEYLMSVAKIRLSAKTATVTNTQAISSTYVSIRESTSADFMNMITNGVSWAAVTQSTPSTVQALTSLTSKNKDTSISSVMIETSTHVTTGMRARKLLCKCPKRLINTKWHFLDGKNITNSEVKKIVLEDFNKNIKSEISVDKKTVSKEVRKKNSSVNKRTSSQSIGWGCIVFLVLPMVFLIGIDILNCCIHFRTRFGGVKRNRNWQKSNNQVQIERPKPLQTKCQFHRK